MWPRSPRRPLGVRLLLMSSFLALCILVSWLPSGRDGGAEAAASANGGGAGRRLLAVPPANACTPRSIETFPPDLFSLRAKQRGAVLLHALFALWLFAALAIVCDEYFVPSLEILCDVLKLKPDVAGATFMAAGSSAPELFTSVIGVFLTESDVGVSTIVGSAVFNILFIVSLCGLFATQAIYLSWWPMFRDCGFYSISVISLITVIYNERVHWYEALLFILLYLVYIGIMYFNEQIDAGIAARFPSLATGGSQPPTSARDAKLLAPAEAGQVSSMVYCPLPEDADDFEPNGVETEQLIRLEQDAEVEHQLGRGKSQQQQRQQQEQQEQQEQQQQQQQQQAYQLKVEVQESDYESPLTMPEPLGKRLYWAAMLPWSVLFVLTVPDCRRPGCFRRLFFLSFATSIMWIAVMSYLLVWMVCAFGDTLGIPDTVMGLTLLAAGTSVPDALSSVLVARDGLGDMAVSNSVGSNVFDILMGLGLPWLVSTGVRNPGGVVTVNSAGLTYSCITLLSTVVFLFVAVYANRMRLDRKLGMACLLLYCGFIAVSILCETNVFGRLNPPPCPRTRF